MFISDLFEKKDKKSNGYKQSETEFGYRKLEPVIHKARQKYPLANDDNEALALYISDKEEADIKDVENQVSNVNRNAQALIQRQQQVLKKQNKELDDIEQTLSVTRAENQRQEKDIEQLVKGVNDANARYAAQEERFRDLTARVAAQKLTQTDIDAANIAKELERGDDARAKSFGAQQIVRNDVNEQEKDKAGNLLPRREEVFMVVHNGKEVAFYKTASMKQAYHDAEELVKKFGGEAHVRKVVRVTESALNSEIEKHLMEMRHAGYEIKLRG